jgi:outer membrane immunogenic protein
MAKRKALTSLAALTLFDIVAAQAQAQTPNWIGFYAGLNIGGRAANVSATGPAAGVPLVDSNGDLVLDSNNNPIFTSALIAFAARPQNAVGGFHAGYNLQLRPNWLTGWEADLNWGRSSLSTSVPTELEVNINPVTPTLLLTGSTFLSATVDWSASLRSRFGYVAGPWLLYGTLGLSLLRATMSQQSNVSGMAFDGVVTYFIRSSSSFSASKLLAGLVLGGGIEHMFAPNWMVRVEYLFTHYGGVNFGNVAVTSLFSGGPFSFVSTTTVPMQAHLSTQTVRIGLSAKLP